MVYVQSFGFGLLFRNECGCEYEPLYLVGLSSRRFVDALLRGPETNVRVRVRTTLSLFRAEVPRTRRPRGKVPFASAPLLTNFTGFRLQHC